jgi:serine O-acetyltransferase
VKVLRRADQEDAREAYLQARRAGQPSFRRAVLGDAAATAHWRGDGPRWHGRTRTIPELVRLMWVSDAFAAQVFYRVRVAAKARGIPVLPLLAHRLSMALSQVCIGDPVVVQPGLYLAHGQVVIDGFVDIGPDVVIFPWVTIGLRAGNVQGPTIESGAQIGTGAKVVGPVTVGAGAKIGANAVVVHDVAAGTTAVGAPARSVAG